MKKPLDHAPLEYFPTVDNCLQIGGVPVTELAKRLGQTPFYAYDRQLLTDRVQRLRDHLPPEISVHYAIKANPMPVLVAHMANLVDGLDVASLGELRVALDAGMQPSKISFAGPGKSDRELAAAIAAKICINIESEGEMERIARIAERESVQPKVAVRVNPRFELKISGMKMTGGAKPFGVDSERVPDMLHRLGNLDLDFQGFHIFSGSQNLNANAIVDAQNQSFELAFRLAEFAPRPIRTLNIGGGFGIPYFPGDQALDLRPISENLDKQISSARQRLPEAEFVLELGRYLVGEAGVYVCEIVDRKISRGELFLITNGGLHHHLAASGNFGQVIRKNFPVFVGNRMRASESEIANVVGPLCTPLDILADKAVLPPTRIGDLIVVYQSGAYGLTASPTSFLSHPAPLEVFL